MLPLPQTKSRGRNLSEVSAFSWAWWLLRVLEEREGNAGFLCKKGENVLSSIQVLAKAEKEPH